MPLSFQLVPFSPSEIPIEVHGTVEKKENLINLEFQLIGEVARVDFETENDPGRRDFLWKKTCFECFFMKKDGSYYETNFSSGGSWNVYLFDSYRKQATQLPQVETPKSMCQVSVNKVLFSARFSLPELDFAQFNPCMVVKSGSSTAYWSIQHRNSKPDFHWNDNFVTLGTSWLT